jgi:hypothetical protein
LFAPLFERWENAVKQYSFAAEGEVMRFINLLLLALILASATFAQSAANLSAAPGVVLGKINWRKNVYIPALYDDPMQVSQDQADLNREQKIISKENANRARRGEAPLPEPPREISSTRRPAPDGPSVGYLYVAEIKNTGDKAIRSVVWEYLVFDTQSHTQVGRHRFVHATKIRPGKSTSLVGYSTTPAVGILSVSKSDKQQRNQYSEQVLISRIEFDDGTFWQRPVNEQN